MVAAGPTADKQGHRPWPARPSMTHKLHQAQAKLSAMHVLILSISSLFNMESDDGERYCEVVQSDQGLWVYSAGWRRRQGRVRSYLGGRTRRPQHPQRGSAGRLLDRL